MTRSRLIYLLLALTLAALACGGGPTPDESAGPALETIVAATLSASSPSEPEDRSAPPPTATPEPAPPASSMTRRIVYRNGGEIWAIEGSGSPSRLATAVDVVDLLISDDGMKVVYVQQPNPDAPVEVHSINFDGSGETTILTPAQLNGLYPVEGFRFRTLSMLTFIPGTHTLLFNTRSVPEGPGLIKSDDLLSLNADDGTLTPIFAPGAGGDFHTAPDGSKMAVVRPNSISIAGTDGSGLRPDLVTYTPVITYSEFMYYAKPVWKPDSSAVGVVIPSEDPLASATHATIWRIPADTGPAENLGVVDGDFYFFESSTGSLLSPDLNRLSFRRETTTDNVYDMHISNSDGTAASVYATGGVRWQGWAPDSTYFAYTLDDPMDLYIGEIGAPPQAVGSCNQVRWMDGSSFLCLSGSRGSWTLTEGAVDGSMTSLDSPAGDFISFDFDLP